MCGSLIAPMFSIYEHLRVCLRGTASNQTHPSHSVHIQLLHSENEIQTQDLICIKDQVCSPPRPLSWLLITSWCNENVEQGQYIWGPLWVLNPPAIVSTKALGLHWACDQSLWDYYYYAAIKNRTEHDQLAPGCLCSHLNSEFTKLCS